MRHEPDPQPAALLDVAATFGTPAFVFLPGVLCANYRAFAATLAARGLSALIAYSYKTNYVPAVCRLLHGLGAGAEVVAAPELELARRLGVPASRLVMNGVVKDETMLDYAAGGGCLVVNLETDAGAAALDDLAARRGAAACVGVRVNPGIYPYPGPHHEAWLMAARKFGHDVASGDALRFCLEVARRPHLRLAGLHVHLGAQITTAAPYEAAMDAVEGLAADLHRRGVAIDIVDVGGGYGSRGIRRIHKDVFDQAGVEQRAGILAGVRAQPDGFDLGRLADRLCRWTGPAAGRPRFVFEPGRCLVAEAMVFLTRIRGIKQSGGLTWLLVDGGISHLPTVTPNEVHRIELLAAAGRDEPPPAGAYAIAGPVCHRGDVFTFDARFPAAPRVGDVIAIYAAGAYSLSMAAPFNAYRAPVVALDDGGPRLVWRRETAADVFAFDVDAGAAGTGDAAACGDPAAGTGWKGA